MFNFCFVLVSIEKQESVSSSNSVAACAACDDVTAAIPDVVIHSADAVTDESRTAVTMISSEAVDGDRDQTATDLVASATSGVEVPWRMRSLSTGDFSAVLANSRSLPHLPFVAAVGVPDGKSSTDFSVEPISRRSLSSLQLVGIRTWCDGGRLRPGGSVMSGGDLTAAGCVQAAR